MLALVKQYHAGQSRNGGRVPYWVHVQSVAEILHYALARAGDLASDPALERDLFLAAQGHDLYEDTEASPEQIQSLFGARVDQFIRLMSNPHGDHDRAAYLRQVRLAPEEVRLIKLADLTDNTLSCAYGIHDLGVTWVREIGRAHV